MAASPWPADLPIAAVLDDLIEAARTVGSAIVVAPPGAGKTTTVPLALMHPATGPPVDGRIVMLEPRRLAARAAAQRMAALLGEQPGQTVGYQTRDERRIGSTTRVEVVTEGVLTRRLQADPTLDGTAVVIFDEVHERNLPTDVGLALLLDARAALRPDLIVIAMSATPDVAALRRVLPDAPIVQSDGRLFPVEVVWLPLAADRGRRPGSPTGRNDIVPAVVDAVVGAVSEQTGDVLVFLPGIGEIRRAERLLRDRSDVAGNVDVLPLAGALSLSEHDAALAPSPPGRRRVVLSTDIAESSLTVAGVRVVVDAGLARVPRFDPRTGMSRLVTVATSRASADQRAGRAGRTEPGACYRLWSKMEHSTRLTHLPAEITQTDLAGTMLEVAAWGTTVDSLTWIERPPAPAQRAAVELLTSLGALDRDGRITSPGQRMLALPVHPRLARMVDAASELGLGGLACLLAATIDERDVLRGRPDDLPADLGVRLESLCRQGRHPLADERDLARVRDRAGDLARRARVDLDLAALPIDRAGFVLGYAFPDRLAYARQQSGTARRSPTGPRGPAQFHLRGGTGGFIAADDPLANEQFLIVADLQQGASQAGARIRLAAALAGTDVARLFADDIDIRNELVFEADRLMSRSEVRLGAIVLDRHSGPPTPGADTVAALVDHVVRTKLAALTWDTNALQVQQRLAFAGLHDPDGAWPDVSNGTLLATLDEWLAPFLGTAVSVADIAALDLSMLLTSRLSWDQSQRLDVLAPRHLTVADGRRIDIDYGRASPTASVRVQDLFGVRDHPAVADGKVPIVLELLSPANRPIQITADLPAFWAGSWTEVRKEMAGRYPKHQWPTDPAHAEPRRMKPGPPSSR